MKLDGYSKQFQDDHPEVGEIAAGGTMTAEKAGAMADIFSRKIVGLSRKPELTFEESRLVDRTADLGARNIVYAMKVQGVTVPPETARELVDKADALTANAVGRRQPFERPEGAEIGDADVERALTAITGGAAGATIAEKPYLRPNVEDFADAAVTGFAEMIREHEASGGVEVPIDDYLAGNLRNMTGHYERAQTSATAAYAGQMAIRQ